MVNLNEPMAQEAAKYTFENIIGTSPSIERVREIAKKMAKTRASILITGERGTGKELFAQAIHNASDRYDETFIALNCAALPENRLESELFGYVDGAFTGAKKGGKLGLFEFAHKWEDLSPGFFYGMERQEEKLPEEARDGVLAE